MSSSILVTVGASIEELKAKLGEARAEVAKTGAEGSSGLSKLGVAGGLALGGLAAGTVALGVSAIGAANKYSAATTAMAGQAGLTAAAATKVGDAFAHMKGTTFDAAQTMAAFAPVAGQLGMVAGHALSAGQAVTVMKAAMDLAEASGTALGASTTDLAGVMQSYGIGVQGAAAASNVLFNTARTTGNSIDTVSAVVDKLHAKLGSTVPSLAETGAMMLELAQHGATGTRGTMALSSGLNTLLGGSKAVGVELKTLGVNLYDSTGKFVGMGSVISQLQPKLAGMTQAQQMAAEKTLFGASAAQLMGSVVAGGVGALNTATTAVNAHGAAQAAASANANTMQGKTEQLKSSLANLQLQIGEKLIPIQAKLVNAGMAVVAFFEKHKAVAVALAAVVGGVLVAAFVAWAVSLWATAAPILAVVAGIALMLSPLILIGVAIYELVTHWSQVWSTIKSVIGDAISFVTGIISGVINWLTSNWQLVLAILTGPIGLAVLFIKDHLSQIVDFFTQLPAKILAVLSNIATWLLDSGAKLIKGLLTGATNVLVDVATFFFVTLPNKVLDGVKDIGKWLFGGPAHDLLWGLIHGAVNVLGDVATFFLVTLPNKVLDAVKDIGKWLFGGPAHDLLWGLIHGAEGILGDVATFFFVTVPKKILDGVKDIGKWLFDAGVHLIQGMIDGVGSMASSLADKVKSVVTAPVGLAKSILGIKSPSTVFAEMGANMMQGLANGILGSANLPAQALAGLGLAGPGMIGGGVDTASSSIAGSLGSAAGGGAPGGGPGGAGGQSGPAVVVHVHGSVVGSNGMAELATMLEREYQRTASRNNLSFLPPG